jgi:hypothetical protein
MMGRREQSLGFSLFPIGVAGVTVGAMPSYLLEHYLPRGGDGVLREARARARAAEALAQAGTPIRYLRSLYVAEDELCFHVFEAPSREAVLEAVGRAGLTSGRITETEESEEES